MELTIGLAFLAGIVSFISPCVLPLVPAYVGYMGGRLTNTVAASVRSGEKNASRSARYSTALHGLFFVAGFTFVFVTIGLLSTAFIQQIGGQNINLVTGIIGRVGGVIIVFFGLHFMGAIPALFARLRANHALLDNVLFSALVTFAGTVLVVWGFTGTIALWDSPLWNTASWIPAVAVALLAIFAVWLVLGGAFTRPGAFWNGTINTVENALYSDTRRQMTASGRQGYGGSVIMGVVFSAGWTPCIGPVYGAVLTLAASGGDVGQAGSLLAAYSLGLGMPFVITALMLDSAQGVLRRLQRRMRMIELVSGAFLILIGFTIAGGQLQRLSERFAGDFAEFSANLEESVVELATGDDDSESGSEIEAAGEPSEGTASTAVALEDLEVGLEIGDLAPDFSTVTDKGEAIALSELRGQVVLLNFWATWCGPCRVEMPAFQAQFEQQGAGDFTILAVNNAESAEDVMRFREELDLTFPLALDQTGTIQTLYGVFSYPSTLLLDQNGVIVARHFGVLTDDQIDKLVDQALVS
ncbi:MAG: redoxin domain-containing protein [Anaerolineae bacterium]|nr:redoxin domain-containing protein [Anaerolineae bacterium]